MNNEIDITRGNRKERRAFSKRAKMPFMIPGRSLPFVKKQHGEISNFYFIREKEIAEENKQRAASKTKLQPLAPIADGVQPVQSA